MRLVGQLTRAWEEVMVARAQRLAFPEQFLSLPEQRVSVQEQRLSLQEQRVALREERVSVGEPRLTVGKHPKHAPDDREQVALKPAVRRQDLRMC